MQHLEDLVGRSRPFHLALVDIDHFKRINDSFGHVAGDELLVAVARKLERLHAMGCTVARLAGDEFAIIGPSEQERAGFESVLARSSPPWMRPCM